MPKYTCKIIVTHVFSTTEPLDDADKASLDRNLSANPMDPDGVAECIPWGMLVGEIATESSAPEITMVVRRVPVLCGCGWGSLSMPEDEVPDECPVCGGPIG